jgi:AmiR/NasT family two-component response regulator
VSKAHGLNSAASEAGADGHLAKPLDHREMFSVLAAVAA